MAPKHPPKTPLIIPPKDRYAKFKTSIRAHRERQANIISNITTFFSLDTHTPSITAMLGPPPISEHAKFCTESWWKPQIESVFEQWLGLLKCDVCGIGVEEVYNGKRRDASEEKEEAVADPIPDVESVVLSDPFVDVQVQEEISNEANIDPKKLWLSPSSTSAADMTSTNLKSTTSTTAQHPIQSPIQRQIIFNEDPWELLVGSKNVLMDNKPWELTQEFLDEIRSRWNRGSELFLFEEEEHLRAFEDCDGFEGKEWVWI